MHVGRLESCGSGEVPGAHRGRSSGQRRSACSSVGSMFGHYAELWQPCPTFGRRAGAGLSVLSRLDPASSNFSEVEALRQSWSVATVGSLHAGARAGDNLPVLLR